MKVKNQYLKILEYLYLSFDKWPSIQYKFWVLGLHDISQNYRYRNNSICDIRIAESCDKEKNIYVPSHLLHA